MSLKKLFLGLLFSTCVFGAVNANAQFITGILSERQLNFRFITIPEADDNMIHMLFFNPTPVQGCANVDSYIIEQDIRGVALYLEVEYPEVTPDRSVRNPHYECTKGAQTAQTIVALNKDQLIENGITTLNIQTNSYMKRYDVEINEDMIRLTEAVPEPDPEDAIEYWFIPDNAVVLTVPMATEDVRDNALLLDQLNTIARLRNLTPIDEVKPGFYQHSGNEKWDNINDKKFYFVDKFDTLKTALENDPYVTIGRLETTEIAYGPEGKYDKVKYLPVYAARAGTSSN